jgi:hypothetical protein
MCTRLFIHAYWTHFRLSHYLNYSPPWTPFTSFLLTFLFSLVFPCSYCLSHLESPPFFLAHMSHFYRYLLRLFYYLLSTILRISQPISKLLTHLYTVLWLNYLVLVFKPLVKAIVASELVSFVIPGLKPRTINFLRASHFIPNLQSNLQSLSFVL